MPTVAINNQARIIATLGPSTREPATIARLIEDGVRVFRVNFSHGDFDDFDQFVTNVRVASEATGIHAGVLGDLCGPKIRIGEVRKGGVELTAGQIVVFQKSPIIGDISNGDAVFSCTLPDLIDAAQIGNRILVNDGEIRLLAIEHEGNGPHRKLICRVTTPGTVTTAKGINVPDTHLNVPAITERDRECIKWALSHEIDFIGLSFVRSSEDVRQLRTLLDNDSIPIVAKIEKPQALQELEEIIQEADILMVARGDLGVEMDIAEVPAIQKRIIALSHDYGKPVIVATQMLQSMIEQPMPTRAEVSDVANAIYDGADAVMLSGETAIGAHPQRAVQLMARIADNTQSDLETSQHTDTIEQLRRPPRKLQETRYRTAALAHGVSTIVRDLDARLVVTWSQQGGGARYLSQNRMNVPIIAASSDIAALRRMSILHAVNPIHMNQPASIDEFVRAVDHEIIKNGYANRGDRIIIIAGEPIGTTGVTNSIRIHHTGDVVR